jgi:hypothetical protein
MEYLRLRDRHKSASASAKTLRSSSSRIRGSCKAKMPSSIKTCGE